MKIKSRIIALALLLCTLLGLLPVTVLADGVANAGVKSNAMTESEATLGQYKDGATKTVADDGYIGIPVDVSVYRDVTKPVKSGYDIDATPFIIYVVNSGAQRVGTDSDSDIILSMIERGYVVVVFDYKNNAKAVSPELDWSVQKMRASVTNGTYVSEITELPKANYINNMVVPAGHNIELNLVYWEFDKHGVDGSFDKIVEVWNNDFRAWKTNRDRVIKWVRDDGSRKATQTAFDGTEPVWLDENGKAAADGQYIMIKHTKAETVTDCVKPDGSPIDLNLYMHIIYPTNPASDVPVMSLACSSEHLAKGTQTADRPQLIGFAMNGYAAVTYEYAYNPMARSDHYGYFDGSTPENGSVTGDNLTYSLGWYNEVKFNTAAMRYLRYLSASEHGKYAFDTEAFGVYGNSKGGWMTLLGEEHPEDFAERRIVPGYDGSTRYENGKTETVGIIDGGEEQPWLSYNGVALDSGADFIYASCGGGSEQITENHVPTYISCNTGDGSCYATSNQFVNVCRNMDVPALWFEINMGHTFASGPDNFYGVDTYAALFTFANYHLRGDAVSVVYADRDATYGGMPTNAPFVIKFSGAVSEEEIAKITLTDSKGGKVNGTWTAQFGNTEWTLASGTLSGDETYTVTVPADIRGDNGKAMGKAFTYSFRTGFENNDTKVNTVKTESGTYVYFTVPDVSSSVDFNADLYTLRLNVANDAVNTLNIYSVSGFDAASPESATVGALVGSSVITGAGQYDISLAEFVKSFKAGDTAAFLVKTAKAASETVVHKATMEDEKNSASLGGQAVCKYTTAPDGAKALMVSGTTMTTSNVNDHYYSNPMALVSDFGIIKGGNLAMSDVGRTFTISVDIYDTVSRIVTLKMRTMTGQAAAYCDYNAYFFNFETKANQWTTFTYEYTVYEPLIGNRGLTSQYVQIVAPFTGATDCPLYIKNITSTERVTDVTVDKAELLVSTTDQRVDPLITPYGVIPEIYADTEKYPYVLFDRNGKVLNAGDLLVSSNGLSGVLSSTQDSTAITSFPNTDTILFLRRDVTFDTIYDNFSFQFGDLLIDLNGYTFTCSGFLFNCIAKRCGEINVTVKNGTILQKNYSLLSYNSVSSNNYPYNDYGVREFNFLFENVTFGYAEGAVAAPFVNTVAKAPSPVKGSIQLVDCTVDLTKNAPEGEYMLFKANSDSNGNIDVDVSVKGGTIKANSLDGITVGTESGIGSFEFVKDGSGSYTEIQLPDTANAPVGTYRADGDSVIFKAFSTASGITTYKLDIDPLSTPYGKIPDEYADAEAYPFVSFQVNGDGTYTFRKAEASVFIDNSAIMIDARNINAVIYMRRDFTVSTIFNNLGFAKNNTFDLGGNTLTATVAIAAAAKKQWNKNVTYKNGTIVTANTSFINLNGSSDAPGYGYNLTFENIIFKRAEGATAQFPMVLVNASSVAHTGTVTYNGCIFDMRGEIPASGIILFRVGESRGNQTVTINVNGGDILLDTSAGVLLNHAIGTKGSVTFGKYNGKYPTLTIGTETASNNYRVSTAEGTKVYGVVSTDGTNDTYGLFPAKALETKYGTIPAKYASAEQYPFVSFTVNADGSYTFAKAEKEIFSDSSAIMIAARSKDTVILLRRDFHNNINAHSNIVHIKGTLILDLDGHALSSEKVMWSVDVKKNGFTTNFIIKDGTLAIGAYPVLDFKSSFTADGVAAHTYNFFFNGITLKYLDGATTKKPILNFQNGIREYTANIEFNDCTFDMKGMKNGTVMFPAGTNDGKAVANITVNGGKILNVAGAALTVTVLGNTDSTFTFGKYDGKYTTLTLTSGIAPADKFSTAEGEMVFTATENGEYVLAKAHTCEYTATVTAPTCTEGGYTTYSCTCDKSYKDNYTDALGHAYDNDYDADCNRCGEIREVELPTEGEVSRKIFWAYEDGVLTVSGRGKIKNFSAGVTPWSHLANEITKVVIGEGITYIGSSAFYCCTNIESVELPESLTAMGNYVFYGCSSLKSITIPEAVTEIGKYSFRRSGLETIDFAIGYGWSAGDKQFSISDITSGGHRFISKSYYKQTWVRNTEAAEETLDPNYFVGGIMHTDVIWELTDIGNGNLKLTIRGNGAMADYGTAGAPWYPYWEQITEIEVQDGVTTVGRCAFYGLKFVRKATVADSVTAIGDYGFYMCRLLKSIELPEGVTVGKDAFVKTGVTL